MKKETTQKKIWQKPEVQDLDVKNTASGLNNWWDENTASPSTSHWVAPVS